MAEPKKRGRPRKQKEEIEEYEVDQLNITKDYLQYIIGQFNEGLKSKKTKIVVGHEYEEDGKVDYIIDVDQYLPFLNLLFDQTLTSGHYVYLNVINDILERVHKLDKIKINTN